MIERLIASGVDGFRLNFSHGNHDFFRPIFRFIREASAALSHPVAILQDLQGPKIRVGTLKDGTPVHLIPGARFVLTTRGAEGNDRIISTTYGNLPSDVRPGDRVLLDDGAIELRVLSVGQTDVETEIVVGGLLEEKKGINLPGTRISAESVTEKDLRDAHFGIEMGVDYIALSFVRAASDILTLRQKLGDLLTRDVHIIAKIEKADAVKNLKEILAVSDGVMVARGDLGVEIAAEKVPLIQKRIIEQANQAEKLVITATQMLESMVDHPRPTRAEASDVANAILDGTDVVMLSEETAMGRYPEKAVRTMASIAHYTETDEEVCQYVERIRPKKLTNFTHAIVHSARAAAKMMRAGAILVLTQSGATAQLASCQRPECPIYAFTPSEKVCHRLALVWGVSPVLLDVASPEVALKKAEEILLEWKVVEKGDVVVIVSGSHPVRGATNMMKLGRIGDGAQ